MRMPALPLIALVALGVISGVARHGLAAQTTRPLDVEYRDVAGRLIGAAMVDRAGYDKLAYLTTRIGNRLSGSPGLERAVAWVAEEMKADGLENVRTQPVKVPHWVRGAESARIVKPIEKPLNMLGLGGSIATPADGITAPVVVVNNFDDLERLGAQAIKGKIVLYEWGRNRHRTVNAGRRPGIRREHRQRTLFRLAPHERRHV